jgi:drug/metabolite transporter (DMT)-like permease
MTTSRLYFTFLASSHFILASSLMFFTKELLRVVPYPFFVSFSQGLAMVPLAFLISWGSHKFPRSLRFLLPPSQAVPWMAASGVLHALVDITSNMGFFASDLDFVLFMRLTQLVWNGLLGFIFLGERLSLSGSLAICLVICGILFIVSDFQWSSSKMGSRAQIFVHSLTIFLTSVGSLVTKQIMSTLTACQSQFQILDYLVWTSVMSLPTTILVSQMRESTPWSHFTSIITPRVLLMVGFATLLHELLHLALTQLHKMASLLTLGVLSQVRLLGTLTISYFVYRQTKWDQAKFFGAGLLVAGGVLYSHSRMEQEKRQLSQDEAPLISDQGHVLSP